ADSGGTAGSAAANVQGERVTFTAQHSVADGPDRAQPAAPASSAVSSATAMAGADPPLSASRARQAAGADTEHGRDDREPVSAPKLTSVIGASGAAPTDATAK